MGSRDTEGIRDYSMSNARLIAFIFICLQILGLALIHEGLAVFCSNTHENEFRKNLRYFITKFFYKTVD